MATPWDADYNVANNHRGWGGGYGGYHGYRHRGNGISTGDVLAGVLILGGIAAIASAASSSNNRDREDARAYPDYRGDSYPNRDYRQDYRDRDDRNSSYSSDSGGQWNDDDYARAREQQGYAQPYPGEE